MLRDALMNCLRARHDAIDAATSKITVHLDLAVQKLGAARVLTYFPSWGETYAHLSDVREKIAVSRGSRNERAAIYATIEAADLPKIIKLYSEFKAMEPSLVKEAKHGRWTAAGGWIVATGLAVAGVAQQYLP